MLIDHYTERKKEGNQRGREPDELFVVYQITAIDWNKATLPNVHNIHWPYRVFAVATRWCLWTNSTLFSVSSRCVDECVAMIRSVRIEDIDQTRQRKCVDVFNDESHDRSQNNIVLRRDTTLDYLTIIDSIEWRRTSSDWLIRRAWMNDVMITFMFVLFVFSDRSCKEERTDAFALGVRSSSAFSFLKSASFDFLHFFSCSTSTLNYIIFCFVQDKKKRQPCDTGRQASRKKRNW